MKKTTVGIIICICFSLLQLEAYAAEYPEYLGMFVQEKGKLIEIDKGKKSAPKPLAISSNDPTFYWYTSLPISGKLWLCDANNKECRKLYVYPIRDKNYMWLYKLKFKKGEVPYETVYAISTEGGFASKQQYYWFVIKKK